MSNSGNVLLCTIVLLLIAGGAAPGADCNVLWDHSTGRSERTYSAALGITFEVIGLEATFRYSTVETTNDTMVNCDCKPCCPDDRAVLSIDAACHGTTSVFDGAATASWNWKIKASSSDLQKDGENCKWRESVQMGSFVSYQGEFSWSAGPSTGGSINQVFDNMMMTLACHGKCSCMNESPQTGEDHTPEFISIEGPELMNLGTINTFTTTWTDKGWDLSYVTYATGLGLVHEETTLSCVVTDGVQICTASSLVNAESGRNMGSDTFIRFEAVDSIDNSTLSDRYYCHVNEPPQLTIRSAGWKNAVFTISLSLDDMDFYMMNPEIYDERVILGIRELASIPDGWKLELDPSMNAYGYKSRADDITIKLRAPNGATAAGRASFDVVATDANGMISVVTIDLPTNSPPIANADSFNNYTTTPHCTATITGNVLPGDSDLDGDPLSASLVPGSGPSIGTLDFHADGSFVYYIDTRQPETTSFQYTVSDGKGGTDTATVTLEVCASIGSPPTLSVSPAPNDPRAQ